MGVRVFGISINMGVRVWVLSIFLMKAIVATRLEHRGSIFSFRGFSVCHIVSLLHG